MTSTRHEQPAALMLMQVPAALAAHILLALRRHEQYCRTNGLPVPAGVPEFSEVLLKGVTPRVSQGQPGSSLARRPLPPQSAGVTPRLLTYAAAAERLGVSVSTVKRRIRDGVITPVRTTGRPRLRTADVDGLAAPLNR